MGRKRVLIGLSGFGRSGKTTAALHIERVYGIPRRHIATPLRAMLAELLRANGLNAPTIWAYLEGPLKESVIPELGVTSRHLQISLGTEWGRRCVNPALWADTWVRSLPPDGSALNDSVRFPNEERAIRAAGGFTILVRRAGGRPIQFRGGRIGRRVAAWLYGLTGLLVFAHDSERLDRLRPDYVVDNDGAPAALCAALDRIIQARGIRPLVEVD